MKGEKKEVEESKERKKGAREWENGEKGKVE